MNKTKLDQGNLEFLGQENENLNRFVKRPDCNLTDNSKDISIYIYLISFYAN